MSATITFRPLPDDDQILDQIAFLPFSPLVPYPHALLPDRPAIDAGSTATLVIELPPFIRSSTFVI